MNTNELICFAIERIDFNEESHNELLEREDDDPEQDFIALIDACFDVTVIAHRWARSPDQALEQAAHDFGFSHVGYWLDFLNAGDGCSASLRAVEAAEPRYEHY